MISLLGVECKTSLKIISNCFIGFSQRIPLIPVLTHQCRMEESQGVLNIRAAWPSKSSKQGFCSTGAGPYQNIWINSTKAVEIFPKQKKWRPGTTRMLLLHIKPSATTSTCGSQLQASRVFLGSSGFPSMITASSLAFSGHFWCTRGGKVEIYPEEGFCLDGRGSPQQSSRHEQAGGPGSSGST